MGRTGKMWAIELADVEPDVLISAKGIASGLPLGAFAAKAELMERWGAGAHGSTYGGSPVSCAAGLATLETIQAEACSTTPARSARSCSPASPTCRGRYPRVVTDVRGVGLMIGVEFRHRPSRPPPCSSRPSSAACWCWSAARAPSGCRRRSW